MKKIKSLLSFLVVVVLFSASTISAYSQVGGVNDKQVRDIFKENGFLIGLKGANGTLPDLGVSYCSNSGKVIVNGPGHGTADSIKWTVVGINGSGAVDYTDVWGEQVGLGVNATYELDISSVASQYYCSDANPAAGEKVVIGYQYYQFHLAIGTPGQDYTSVYLNPTAFNLTGGGAICDGLSTKLYLSDSEENITYYLLDNGLDAGQSLEGTGGGLEFTVTQSGKYTVVARNTNNVLCETTMNGEIDVLVYPAPVPSITSNSPVCKDAVLSLEELNGGFIDYDWTGPDGKSYTGQTVDIDPVAFTDDGEFTLEVTDGNGCTATVKTLVEVRDIPTVNPSYNAPVCDGGSLVISSNASGGSTVFNTYVWTKDGAPIGGNSSTLTINPADTNDSGTYGVTVIDNNGCGSAEATVVVDIQALPTVTINTFDLVTTTEWCEGETIVLTGGGGNVGAVYSWLLADGSTLTGSTLTLVGADKLVHEGAYTLTVTEGTCSSTLDHNVVVNNNPIAVADKDGDVCLGSDFTLRGNPGSMVSYVWTNSSGTVVGSAQDITLSSNDYGVGTHEFTLTIEDGKSCNGTDKVTVTIWENPVTAPTYNSPVCDGGRLEILANATGGTGTYINYTWTKDGAPIAGNGATQVIDPASLSDAGVYGVIATDDNGCVSTEATVSVDIQALPTVTIEGSAVVTSTDWCEGETLTLTGGGGTAGAVYSWLLPDGGTVSGSLLTLTNITKAVHEGTYTLTITEGTCINTLDHNVTVHFNPNAVADKVSDVCLNSDFTLTGNPAGMTYSWTDSGGTPVGSMRDITLSSIPYGVGDHTFTLTIEDGYACQATDDVTVTVWNNPTTTPTYNTPVCIGEDIVINANATGGSGVYLNYAWTKDGAPLAETGPTLTIVGSDLTDSGIYGVIAYDDNGCESAEGTVSVTVITLPTVLINGDATVTTTELCENATITLVGSGGSALATYTWLLADGSTQNGATLTIANANKVAHEGLYTLTVTEGTCVNSLDHNVAININPNATADKVSDVCLNSDFTLTGSPAGMTYSWTDAGGTSVGSMQDITLSSTPYGVGDHTFTLTIEDGNNCQATDDVTVTVWDNPTTTPTYNTPVCIGEDIVINANAAGGSGVYLNYAWTKDGAPLAETGPTLTIVGSDLTDSGVYGVIAYDNNGCESAEGTVSVTVITLPTVLINGDATVTTSDWCENSTITLVGSGGSASATYTWLLADGSTQNGATLTIANANKVAHEGLYTLTVTEGTCVNSLDHNVVINSNPIAVADNSGSTCLDGTFDLIGDPDGMDIYTWTDAGGTVVGTNQDITLSSATYGVGSHVFTLDIEDTNGCVSTDNTTVTINTVDASISVSAPAPGATTICAGTPVTFNANAANGSGTYAYEFHRVRSGADNIMQDSPSATYVATGADAPIDADEFYVIVKDGSTSCTDQSTSIIITVVSNPVPTLSITNNGNSSIICEGEALDFEALPTGFVRYVFNVAGSNIQDGASNVFTYTGFNDGDHVNVTAYTALDASACFGTSSDITVQVKTRPNPTIVGNKTVCVNVAETYEADILGLGVGSYTWVAIGGTITGADDEESVEVEWDGSGTNSLSLNYVNVNGCDALAPTVDPITVNVVTAGLSADRTTVCEGDDVTFTATGGDTYEWYIDGNLQVVADPTNPVFVASGLLGGETITVKAIDAINCEDTHAGITITVNPIPTPGISGLQTVCNSDQERYSTEPGHINYKWTVTNGTIVGADDQFEVDVLWDTDGDQVLSVYYEFTGGCGPAAPSDYNVKVNPLPLNPTFVASPGTNVIVGTDITFTAGGGTTYAFYINNTEVQAESTVDTWIGSTTLPTPDLVDGDIVSVDIFTADGCSIRLSLTVGVFEGLVPFDVLSSAIEHCFGESVDVYLSGSQNDITYELFRVSDNSSLGTVVGDGTANVRWNGIVGASPAEEFRVEAYHATVPADRINMNNTILILEHPDLQLFKISPNDTDDGKGSCGTTTPITLDGSELDVNYQLLANGANVGSPLAGTGNVLDFGVQSIAAVYTIEATHAITGCVKMMDESWEIQGTPPTNTYEIQAKVTSDPTDGRFCTGDAGVNLYLSNSDSGTDYELFYQGAALTPAVILTGTGAELDFGVYNQVGTYTVMVNESGCYYPMNGSVNVTEVPLPQKFTIVPSNNGHYCNNVSDGVELVLDNQELDVIYHLLQDGTEIFSSEVAPVVTLPITGTAPGASLSFGSFLTEASYTVQATIADIGCPVNTDAVNVIIDPTALPLTIEGHPEFCTGGSTLLFINNFETDVTYELILDGTPTGDNGTINGGRIEWIAAVDGVYDVQGVKNNTNTACGPVNMANSIAVVEVVLPVDRTVDVIVGDITTCEGDIIKVLAPEASMEYSVINNTTNAVVPGYVKMGTDVNGDGDVEFAPLSDNGGSYRVEASNGSCSIILDDTQSGGSNEIVINNPNAIAKKELVAPTSICEGDGAVQVVIRSTDPAVNYDLYKTSFSGGQLIETVVGDGGDIAFADLWNEGEYYVIGYLPPSLPTDPCSNEMLNRVTVFYNSLPIAYKLEGSGLSCGTDGAKISIEGSQLGYDYTLIYHHPTSGKQVADQKIGTGSKLEFTGQTVEGDYTVYGVNPATGCSSAMEGTITVKTVTEVSDQLLTKPAYTYCSNGTGAELVLQDQEFDVYYEVREADGLTQVLPPVQGSNEGSPLILGEVPAGTYTIFGAYDAAFASCVRQLNNAIEVVVTSEPEKPLVSISAAEYCFGEDGVDVTVDNAVSTVGYQLTNSVGDIVSFVTGVDGIASFPNKVKGTDTYVVNAVSFATGCDVDSDPFDIREKDELFQNNLFIRYSDGTENGNCDDSKCFGLIQVDTLLLDMSTIDVEYILYLEAADGTMTEVKRLMGTGLELSFDVQSEGGNYRVVATKEGCETPMLGDIYLAVQPLIAVNDIFALQDGELIGEFNVAENDIYLDGVDEFQEEEDDVDRYRNLEYEIINTWDYLDEDGNPATHTTFGEATINSEGRLEYKKLPNFFGRDSVRYRVHNIVHPEREDIATVFIFIGNVNVDDGKDLLIPNAFSPNGDGFNDTYVISGSFVDELSVSKLEVFNRWGTVIYRSKGDVYGANGEYWDGTSNAGAMVSLGDKLPSGTYFYVFTIEVNIDGVEETKQYTGFIELRR